MIPEAVYTVEYGSWGTSPSYRVAKDGESLYRTDGTMVGDVSFVTADGDPAFRVVSWGLSDPRTGYAVRDADGDPIGWVADAVPLVGRRVAIRSMGDVTLATLGDDGWLGKLFSEASKELPLSPPSELVLKTPEGQRIGTAKRRAAANSYTLAVDDVGLDHRLVIAALVVLNNADAFDRLYAARRERDR